MAEFIGEKDKNVNIVEPIVFENKTDSAFEVSAGIVFHKNGIYEVSVLKNKTIVSKVTEQKTGKWINQDEGASYPIECSECHKEPLLDAYGYYVFSDYCPHCGIKMEEIE